MNDNQGRAILGDDMGVGKTLQVLGWLAMNREARPVVIVCPANAKYEWEEQMSTHTKYMRCEVLTGRKPYKIREPVVIVNYDILSYWEEALIEWRPQVLIMDECHAVKSRGIKRTKTCKKLSQKAKHVIPMSGTAIVNRPVEFYPVLNMIRPGEFRSFWKYAFRYCRPRKGFQGRGWHFDGATNTDELHKRVAEFMIRRMKKDVLTDLPPKRRIPVRVDIDNMKEYTRANTDFKKWYLETYGNEDWKKAKKGEDFVKIGKLRQLTALGKMTAAVKWIDDFLETTDEKLVIFSYHRASFDLMVKKYKKISAVGGKAGIERKMAVKRFQKDKRIRLYIGSIKSDKEAITLTAASTVLFLELAWTPGEHEQAEDRVNRIGQTSSHISAYYILGKDTIDEYIWSVLQRKRKVIAKILDGKDVDYAAERRENIKELFSKLRKRNG